ncbi:autotransporter outer membrane beta-barrel domain-containing protein [Sphingomonas sp. RHCKR47]|uniref:autotransporter outer membrane beta-barrel domain-containing protein n=1 Tax=Sphingomonas citricola TaxID=2862498 RepID=UPI001CA56075|nr:autotransporter outer membrane beta-barrel domain-containing protein [Sphingomonas citricola]MBW6525083.1 autotransporter outer membrane beta-barrel domain-containing protein [Sphingomonas citricola]
MNLNGALRGQRVRRYALGTSGIALAMVLGGPAEAQCSPDPTTVNGTTNCTGTDDNGLTVTTNGTRVIVAKDAIVRAGTTPAAITLSARDLSLSVAGLVDGDVNKAAVLLTAGAPTTYICTDPYAGPGYFYCTPGTVVTSYPSANASISIAAGGSLTGAQGLVIRRDPANTSGSASAYVTNAGTITGRDGRAILADGAGVSALSLTNTTTGTVNGSVSGAVSYVTNAGRIVAGNNGAIASSQNGFNLYNTGSVTSTGTTATVTGTGYTYVSNAANATIGGSATAISASGVLSLTNTGTINGSVLVTSTGAAVESSTIDTRSGTINGDLTLGAGNDILRARYDVATGRVSSITGSIDGGAGTDTLAIGIDADTTIARAVLPTNFELLGLDLSNNATVTLASSFTAGNGIALSGSGSVVNQAALVTRGPAVTTGFSSYGPIFNNQASITATLDSVDQFAVSLTNKLTNSGTITAVNGAGVRASSQLDNSGTITASGTGAALDYATLNNSGTIRSSAGVGVTLYSYGVESTNSGIIAGATTGLSLSSGRLTNTGTISGGVTGALVGGTLINAAGGTVTGGTVAVASNGGARLVNAGTIIGSVDFTSPYYYDSSSDLFVDDGGSVSGAIRLGGGDDTLVVTLGDTGRPFAGAAGGVDAGAGFDTLRYRVNADASATTALSNGFEGLAFEVANGAALTLAAANGGAGSIGLTGQGSVTLTGSFASSGRSLIDTTILNVAQLTGAGAGETRDLSVINNGTLSISASGANYGFYNLAAILGSDADITNNGTIIVSNAAGTYYPASAISGGVNVSNAGTITLGGGGSAITGAQNVTNTGTITATGTNAVGVSGATTLVNSGTIRSDGTAVQSGYYSNGSIINSGTIESRFGTAVMTSYYGGELVNEAGGTITGLTAVDLSNGGTVVNRGMITGNVAAASYYSYSPATYVSDGGTLTGNLTFGSGQDTLVLFGETSGISGMIDGGDGTDTLIQARRASSTVTLGTVKLTGFEREGVRALGSDTVVNVRADAPFTGDLLIDGDGEIVNTATINGAIRASYFSNVSDPTLTDLSGALALTNQGTIANGVSATLRRFTNAASATIGSATLSDNAVSIAAVGDLVFDNSGTISSNASYNAVYLSSYAAGAIAATNRGTINGGLSAYQQYGSNRPTSEQAATIQSMSLTNSGTITGGVSTSIYLGYFQTADQPITSQTISLTNAGSIEGGVFANIGSFYSLGQSEPVTTQAITLANSGTITEGVYAVIQPNRYTVSQDQSPTQTIALTNDGTITSGSNSAVLLGVNLGYSSTGNISLANSGAIEATAAGGNGASVYMNTLNIDGGAGAIAVSNSGTIRANAGGNVESFFDIDGTTSRYTDLAVALYVGPAKGITTTVSNTGTIEATGNQSTAVMSIGATAGLALTNAGTIRGSAGTLLDEKDEAIRDGSRFVAGAIQTYGGGDDRITNTGTIIGSVALGAGNDRIDNLGRIEGDVFLGDGDDTFLHRASAVLIGTVDGGLGTDSLIIDATGGGAVNGDQFVNFERFSQIGEGNVAYSGNFRFDTIGVSGSTITVAAGQTLASAGAITITGSDAAELVDNRGTIAGGVALGGGNDRVDNRGTIAGTVSLGDGDDVFVDYAGSNAGLVDGGAGTDLYRVILAGNRTGIGQRTGFERLSVEGQGTLALTLDQPFDQIALAGTGLDLTLGGFTIGQVTGSDAAETLRVDGDVASVQLGAGDDVLALGTTRAAGNYAGGAGSDTLRFTANAPVTLVGTATGFEQVTLAGNALTIAGTLGSANASLAFDDGAQRIEVANGGTLAGVIDLGAGNDALRLAAGSTLAGTVSGGAGSDSATLVLAGDRALAAGVLRDFELLASEGNGTLTLTGAQTWQRIAAGTDLAVAGDGVLTADQVQFGARDDRFTIAGRFAGQVDGGAGSDTIAVSGGSASTPVAFSGVANIERYVQSGGFATMSGNAALGLVNLSAGRLVGLTGSIINASQINVAQGATFGSGGTVNGNLAIAGTLSPGAGIGTMTVNGNVALAGTSVSAFEIAPTGADRLQVNGSVSIANGATLQLTTSGAIRPGTSYDLVVATGGINGSYTTIQKPDTLFGFVVQRADRIQLLGQFLGGAGFSPQVQRSIAYANTTLQAQAATSPLFAALPALLNADGSSNARAFAQLTPEAYASATQAGVDNALTLASAARSPAFATMQEDPGLFTFAQTVGQWHTLGDDPAEGTAKARTRSYGFLGGLGYGNAELAVGAFGGYLNTHQSIDALGAVTKNDGFVAGAHARYAGADGLGITASVLYDGGQADTVRALPGAARAAGRYDLHSWVGDLSVSYAIDMAADWSLRPRAGVTYLRTTRDGVAEAGGAFALNVARDRHVSGFVDGGVTLARSDASPAPFRPYVSLGVRYQVEGRRTDAVGAYAGGPLDLVAFGAQRARAVGTAAAGMSYRLAGGLDLFSTVAAQTGRDDHQESISTGVRLRF